MTFDQIPKIDTVLSTTLTRLKFHTLTPVQAEAIPKALEGKDLLVQSKTGSGKTLAFSLPLLLQTNISSLIPQSLIITPTRELAEQIAQTFRAITAHIPNFRVLTLYGGVPLRPQADALEKGAHILIGTPGRLLDHLGKETIQLNTVRSLVLDEADKMLSMGFYEDILSITTQVSKRRQTLFFSATYPEKVEKLANTLLQHPVTIKIETLQHEDQIDESVYLVENKDKALLSILQSYQPGSVLIFCNTKETVLTLTEMLRHEGHSAIDLQGDLTQRERQESVIQFSNGSKRILVATDVASRGLDIKEIDMVVNHDLPWDQELYTHRIGRTGRAGASGTAISLFSPRESAKCVYVTQRAEEKQLDTLSPDTQSVLTTEWQTLTLNGGKKAKLRKGDILGTFCKEIGIEAEQIGQIDITETFTYVALHNNVIDKVQRALHRVKIKKKKYRSWVLD